MLQRDEIPPLVTLTKSVQVKRYSSLRCWWLTNNLCSGCDCFRIFLELSSFTTDVITGNISTVFPISII